MAVTRALAADGEQITNTELTVTSALAFGVQAFLPVAGDGSNGTANEGASVSFSSSNAGGSIEVLDKYGHKITTCKGKSNALVTVENGKWVESPALDTVALRSASVVANGSGATAVGSKAPAAVATATQTAGWVSIVLPDGTKGYIPYWQ